MTRYHLPAAPRGHTLAVRRLTAVHVTETGVDLDGPTYPPGTLIDLPDHALVLITRQGIGELGLDTTGVVLATADPDTGRLRQLHDEHPADNPDSVVRHLERRVPPHR
ncbi:hypothetical protein OG216_08670 [Streptomycetaceae bacterium NBC_01309]